MKKIRYIRNKGEGMELIKLAIFLMIIFILSLSATLQYSTILKDVNASEENTFYKSVIISNIPAFDDKDTSKYGGSHLSFENILSRILNMSMEAPQTILSKETSFLFNKETTKHSESNFASRLKSFVLNEGDIIMEYKPTEEATLPEQSEGNLINTFDENFKISPKEKPQILIYHTHTLESYADTGADSSDNLKNIVKVGDVLKTELEKYGYNVVHDTTNNSLDYNNAYSASRNVLQNNLNQYGEFQLVIDLHRDAVPDKSRMTFKMADKNIAKMSFVWDTSHSTYNENINTINGLKNTLNTLYPGFYNSDHIYNHGKNHFNLDLTTNIMLVEMGSHVNTIEEASNGAMLLARGVAQYLYDKNS